MNVLLTGTRAPATLDLARRLGREGVAVVGADSMRFPLGRFSKAFRSHHRLPPPRQDPEAFAEALARLIERERIDIVWPTCEEIFHLAAGRAQLPARVRLLCAPLEVLETLHHKLRFARLANEGDGASEINAPFSWPAAEAPADRRLVWKPCYSRFAARTRFDGPPPAPAGWMAQEFVAGREFCSWAFCVEGDVRVQTFYECPARAGRGAGCAFEPMWSDSAAAFVAHLAHRLAFTGSLAFDFIQTPEGKTFVLECNPRLTSGLHVLDPGFRLSSLLENPALPPAATHTEQRAAQLWLPTLVSRPRLAGTSPDVISCREDLHPVWGQFFGAAEFAWRALRHRVPLLAATTHDIEYNGR